MNGDSGRAVLLAALVWVALVAVAVAVAGGGLGNDEAQYALGARTLVGDDGGASGTDPYPLFRPIGMRVLAAPGVLAGGGELALRLPFVLIAMGYVALVWRLAWRLGGLDAVAGRRAAVLAVAVQVSAAPWLARSGEALSDLAATALLLGMVVLIVEDVARARARMATWLGVAVAGAAAFHVRYGSAPVIAMLVVGALVTLRERRAAVALAGAAMAAMMAPFLWWSHVRTGDVLGVLKVSEDAANRAYVGEGLVWYATQWGWGMAGPVMGAVALAGIVAALRRPLPGPSPLPAPFYDLPLRRLLLATALGQILVLGLRAHGEARYVFFATTILTVLGACWLAAHTRPRLRQITLALCALSAIAGAVFAVARADRMNDRRVALMRASAAVRADAAGASCVVMTGTQPQVAWYTRCRTRLLGIEPVVAEAAAGFERVYIVAGAGAPRQPEDGAALSGPGVQFQTLVCGERPRWCVWKAR